jgi:hypothetical protein
VAGDVLSLLRLMSSRSTAGSIWSSGALPPVEPEL